MSWFMNAHQELHYHLSLVPSSNIIPDTGWSAYYSAPSPQLRAAIGTTTFELSPPPPALAGDAQPPASTSQCFSAAAVRLLALPEQLPAGAQQP
jgi:hypothetical protein